MTFKLKEQIAAVSLMCASICLIVLIPIFPNATSKLLGSSGLGITLVGLLQIDIAGLFEKLTQHLENTSEQPFGPPSYICRQIISNPDPSRLSRLRELMLFNPKVGFWLIVSGTLLQIFAIWV